MRKTGVWLKGYLNEVGRKLSIVQMYCKIRLKGYLNEVGRKSDQQQYDYGHGFKGYLNKVGKKLKPIDLHGIKGI